jgi:hypothetical protein
MEDLIFLGNEIKSKNRIKSQQQHNKRNNRTAISPQSAISLKRLDITTKYITNIFHLYTLQFDYEAGGKGLLLFHLN